MTRKAPYALVFMLLFCLQLTGHDINVKQVFPKNLSTSHDVGQSIWIVFEQAIKPGKVKKNIKVQGETSGQLPFDYSLSNFNKTLTISFRTEEKSPSAGELITVNIAKDIQSKSNRGYVWQFYTKTKRGTLELTKKETLSLRQPGEGWLKTIGAYGGDLNNDNFSDLTIINENTEDLRIFMNDGAGQYSDMKVIPIGQKSPNPAKGADFNNDGEIDLAVSSTHSQLRVLMGDGSGSFYQSDKYESGSAARSLVVLDFDGDGDEDIAVANLDRISLFENNSEGKFTKKDIDPKGIGESCIAAVDANQDGFMDLFIGFANSNEVGLLLGDGKGGFELSDLIKVQGSPRMLEVADLNGDGNADVVSANAVGHLVLTIFGDGTGGLYGARAYALKNAKSPSDVELGDLDGDGDLDLVSSNFASGNFVIWENNAQGIFSKVDMFAAPANASYVLLHDRDNDGDLDFTGLDETEDMAILFENNPPQSVNVANPGSNEVKVDVGPNPFISRLQIKVNITFTGRTDIRIVNSNGQTIERLCDERLSSGMHYFGWDGGRHKGLNISSGVFYVVVTQNGKTQSIPVTKA